MGVMSGTRGRKPRVHVITMGCAKNTVDSEKLMAQLRLNRIPLAEDLAHADVAVINTCGFIDEAKQESLDMMISVAHQKGGRLRRVYAMGCLAERYRVDLEKEIPEVDRFFGTDQLADVLEELGGHLKRELLGERVLTTPAHTAYLKISEGCDHPCSFCAIPLMRGEHRSRPVQDLLDEAAGLARGGVREIIVIAQDTTAYGVDVDGKRWLPGLLERLADIPGIEWVRLMYAYPAHFPLELLDVMARHPRICNYLDIPLQHVSDGVLKSMARGMSTRALRELLATIRQRVPGIAVRTTLIVGYPTEGPEEFEELRRFVEEQRFERLGVFAYSREEGTDAFPLGDPVSREEKEHRRAVIMELQREIAEEHNTALIGTTQRVLVERLENGRYYGRTERDAPEIDNEVVIDGTVPLDIGTFHEIEIVEAYEYDLLGKAKQ
jgi:ribosomal protein S12 methylthiotransferase